MHGVLLDVQELVGGYVLYEQIHFALEEEFWKVEGGTLWADPAGSLTGGVPGHLGLRG